MARTPVVLVHGYSDSGRSFRAWRDLLVEHGYRPEEVRVCSYRTQTNEVTIKDLAEGFDRALRAQAGLGDGQPFDAIVHSTGMLVVRSWLTQYAGRRTRLKHLIGIAPATWGSPLAHKGRSWLGAIFKGNRDVMDPDFMDAGHEVLDALELGSRFTWDLAHLDLLGGETYYGPSDRTPWVFTLCGIESYTGLRGIVNAPGTDGTVRWAGCALNTRKIRLDLTIERTTAGRATVAPWTNVDSSFVPIAGVNHGTILTDPRKGDKLVDLVLRALQVRTRKDYGQWQRAAAAGTAPAHTRLERDLGLWQQFVVRATDERGDPIDDYHLQLVSPEDNPFREAAAFELDVHTYRRDPSLRCFHLDLRKLQSGDHGRLRVRVMASAASTLVTYHGHGSEKAPGDGVDGAGKWDGQLDIASVLGEQHVKLFYPFTT
ncbi:MAG: esterase/lipase family protein, partial [Candidatus Rokuibacteriota bacterium]